MFTGIIEEIGTIREITSGKSQIWVSVHCAKIRKGLVSGDSVAVNGVCLTVSQLGTDWFAAAATPETIRKTGLQQLRQADRVNLERALRLCDRLAGHIVSGHIDGTGTVTNRMTEGNAIWLTVAAATDIMRYIVMKGSVTLDGTSLTVAHVDYSCFKVSLIPLTAGVTTLGTKKPGDRVNIECDMIGKYVEKLFSGNHPNQKQPSDISRKLLKEHGFV